MAVYVTNLEQGEATLEQVALFFVQRSDTENVFDELKNQWLPELLSRPGRGDGTGCPIWCW